MSSASESAQVESAKGASPTSPAVTLIDVDSVAAIEQQIASQRGKVTVVDMWATWCPPCVAEFPRLVQLQQTQGDAVACISLGFDYDGLDSLDETRERVLRFLKKHEAKMINLLSTMESDKLHRELKIPSIPVVDVYDRQGKLRQRFDAWFPGGFTYDHVERLVDELVQEPSDP